MKKIITLLAIAITLIASAQAPQGFNYQATVRNSAGALIINQNVNFKFNVMLNSQTSLPVYSETHLAPTDNLGQVNLVVGTGTATSGTFAGINWANGTYYLGIELNTGSGYVAMGTTQLLSVPYALYANSAGNSPSQGKTSIYLTGNITNAQAAAKIAAELGPNTENIYIKNTNQLTSVDLSAVLTISTIEISNNSNLTNVNLNNLATIEDEFSLYDSSAMTSLSFPSLTFCSSFNVAESNIGALSFPLLNYINEFNLTPCYVCSGNNFNTAITTLNFPSLQTIGGNFYLNNIISLTSLTFPVLQTLSGSISLQSYSGMGGGSNYNNLNTISFPALTTCNSINGNNNSGGSGNINLPLLTNPYSINLSSLTSCNSISLGNLTNLNLSNLTSCQSLSVAGITNFTPPSNLTSCNSLHIDGMPNLTSLSFPSLSNCNSISIIGNPILTSVSFPALSISSDIVLQSNALTTSNINSLLNKMLTVSPTVAKNIYLYSQTPPAPPTGQGIINKQALINAGNNVYTD